WLPIRRRESGHLWQNRFFSCPLEDAYTWAALAYVERNAVRAGMVAQCEEWPWSSARQHLGRTNWCDWLALQEWSQNWTPALWRVALQEGLIEADFRARLHEATRTGKTLRRRSIHRAVRAASGSEFAKTEARTEAKTARVMYGFISGLSKRCNEMDWGVTVTVPDLPDLPDLHSDRCDR